MSSSYLDLLNNQQRAAVCCTDAPSLVIAGAGSGKTRVLTAKIAYLLEHDQMDPQNIMALTFTNKAAAEMKQRIATLVGSQAATRITAGTFHSVFARILRREHDLTGYSANFTIYDTNDSENLVKQILREMQLDEKKQYKPSTVLSRISKAKNMLILPQAYPASAIHTDQASSMPAVVAVYKEYQARLKQADAMDFDDLLLVTWQLLHDHPEVTDRLQDNYKYILVDEYQDTNYAQHQIVLLLTRKHQRICVVGDDAQSIYSFRGAEIGNILNFQQAYTGARLFKLEQNYRSTQTIVQAAGSLIRHNRNQIPKDVFSRRPQGHPIEVFRTYSDLDEAATITRYLTRLHHHEHVPYSEMAILYRTNSQSRSLEEELRRKGIPYHIYGGLSFYQRKEVKDAIAYLRLCVNPCDETALRRIINYPARGIGETTQSRVWQTAKASAICPWEVVLSPESYKFAAGPTSKLKAFATLIQQLREAMDQGTDVYTLMLQILSQSGMQADLFHGTAPDDITRQQNLQELTDSINTFVEERREQGLPCGANEYLQEVSLLTDQDNKRKDNDGEEQVTLMTVHASKGLEFRAVCVTGLEENIFPSQMEMDNPRGMEEERRLFYVAMTRAGEYLALSCARSRMRYGHTEFFEPSRFLSEIDPKCLAASSRPAGMQGNQPSSRPQVQTSIGSRFKRLTTAPSVSTISKTSSSTIPPMSNAPRAIQQSRSVQQPKVQASPTLQPGQRVVHERFGQGTVERVEGSGIDARATVAFDGAGRKQLLLRFARIKLV